MGEEGGGGGGEIDINLSLLSQFLPFILFSLLFLLCKHMEGLHIFIDGFCHKCLTHTHPPMHACIHTRTHTHTPSFPLFTTQSEAHTRSAKTHTHGMHKHTHITHLGRASDQGQVENLSNQLRGCSLKCRPMADYASIILGDRCF